MNKLVKKLSLLAVIAMFGTSLVGCGKGVDVKKIGRASCREIV